MNDITPESKSFLEMKPKLKNYSGEDWTVKAPRLDIYGRDLLSSLLRYHNSARISARCAMKHHVFEVFPANLKLDGFYRSFLIDHRPFSTML